MRRLLRTMRARVGRSAPALSIVVILFDMDREGRRTLYSLSPRYQRGVGGTDYEVIVVDNGSVPAFPAEQAKAIGPNVRHFYRDNASASPAPAINFGVRQSRGEYVAVMIDGARMVTPGLVQHALRAFRAFEHPVVTVPAWHLGPEPQRRSMRRGYDKETEDKLLAQIGWPDDGYRLFEIAALAESCNDGWFLPMGDSSCLFMSRSDYDRLGGYDERFDAPGGGLVSQDTYRRACEMEDAELVVLLGEGTFHQLHGGVSTNTSEESFAARYRAWSEQYRALRGGPHERPRKTPHFLGHLPPQARPFLLLSAERAVAKDPA